MIETLTIKKDKREHVFYEPRSRHQRSGCSLMSVKNLICPIFNVKGQQVLLYKGHESELSTKSILPIIALNRLDLIICKVTSLGGLSGVCKILFCSIFSYRSSVH